MTHPDAPVSHTAPAPKTSRNPFSWLIEGLRAAFFMRPRWERLGTGLVAAPLLVILLVVMEAAFQWNWFPMEVVPNIPALLFGWLPWLVLLWVCHALGRRSGHPAVPGTARLFGIATVQVGLYILTILSLSSYVYLREPDWPLDVVGWVLWPGLVIVYGVALAVLLVRAARSVVWAIVGAVLVFGVVVVNSLYDDELMWAPADEFAYDAPEPQLLRLTQSVMERQPELLTERLGELQPQRPGVADMYVLTFAPYAPENVFRRESAMVAEVMAQRFDAEGRTLQLVNNLDTLEEWPWATPLNLMRAIRHIASRMDLQEDVLFIHLTSHGARDGELAASFPPMTVESVSPEWLRTVLDQASVQNRVISVSACYSGTWVEPLADDRTLIMTAADADNTSYGCGMRSELTFYGRAVFDELLRTETRSFEEALNAARPIIEQREVDAGKDDGYSNPQIHVGEGVRAVVKGMLRRLAP